MNKSLITTIATGFRHDDKPVITEEYVEEQNGSIKNTAKTGYETDEVIQSPKELKTDISNLAFYGSVKETMDTGFGEYEKLPPPPRPDPKLMVFVDTREILKKLEIEKASKEQIVVPVEITDDIFEESVKETMDTGFGDSDTLHKECPEPKAVQYLGKENYLSEFKTETDKTLARENLGVYSSDKIDQLLKSITNNVSGIYVTKSEVQSMIEDIKLVDSTLKAYANYEVPSNLFRL